MAAGGLGDRDPMPLPVPRAPALVRGQAGENVGDQSAVVRGDVQGGQGEHPGIGFAAAKLFVEEGAYAFITGRCVGPRTPNRSSS